MDGRRVGSIIRVVRLHERLRQQDLADRCGVSQRSISELERGRIDHLSLPTIDRVCRALDITARLDLWWRGGDIDRLLDRDHAAIVEHVVRRLRREGWHVRLEYGFNHFGERGSVDILGWHPETRSLLIVEVKASLTDLQAMLAALARKVRIVPEVVGRDGWVPDRTAYLLVVLGTKANRRIVARHPQIFDVTFPDRAHPVLSWLRAPASDVPLRGLWMVSPSTITRGDAAHVRPRRFRPRPEPLPTPPGSG